MAQTANYDIEFDRLDARIAAGEAAASFSSIRASGAAMEDLSDVVANESSVVAECLAEPKSGAVGVSAAPLAVRRPVLGLVRSEPSYARIEVTRRGAGGDRELLLSSAVRSGRDRGITNFILQGLTEGYVDPTVPQKSFGSLFFASSGVQATQLQVTALILDAENFPWASEWRYNYEHYLRAQRCIQNNAEVVLTCGFTRYTGMMLTCSLGRVMQTGGAWELLSVTFTMILTRQPEDINPAHSLNGDDPFGSLSDQRYRSPGSVQLHDETDDLSKKFVPTESAANTRAERRALRLEQQQARQSFRDIREGVRNDRREDRQERRAAEEGMSLSEKLRFRRALRDQEEALQHKEPVKNNPESGWFWLHELETVAGAGANPGANGTVTMPATLEPDADAFSRDGFRELLGQLGIPPISTYGGTKARPDLNVPTAAQARRARRTQKRQQRLEAAETAAAEFRDAGARIPSSSDGKSGQASCGPNYFPVPTS